MRRSLVVFQFFVSIVLIVGTLVVQKQLHFFVGSDLGFDREAFINIPITEDSLKNRTDSLKTELLKLEGVEGATACFKAPIGTNTVETGLYTSDSDKDRFDVHMNFIDTDYIKAFGLRLVAGRNLRALTSSDQDLEFLLNETVVRQMGLAGPQDALGKILREGMYGRRKGSVVGVVADFHAVSLQQKIPAMAMVYWPYFNTNLAVKLRGGHIPETLAAVEKVWRSFSAYPFEYTFLDDDIRGFYNEEQRLLGIVTTFAGVAVILACLGLLGLSSFMAQQRTKEIGVRKVLGASVGSIMRLLSREFTLCIMAANLLAWPLAYLAMNRWLESFAYRTSTDLWVFLLAGVLTFSFAMLTVGYQTLRAASANPVESLRYE